MMSDYKTSRTAIKIPSTPEIIGWLKSAGKILLREIPDGIEPGAPKDELGSVLTIWDKEVQCHIVKSILSAKLDYHIIGEEDVEIQTGGACKCDFPEDSPPSKIIAIIDPTDGSNNWTIGETYSLTFALQHNIDVVFAAVYFPLTDKIFTFESNWGMSKNGEAYKHNYKAYNQTAISACYGMGKALSNAEQNHFIELMTSLGSVELNRLGCASASFFQVFDGKRDCYLSAKERWTNIAPLYKFATHLGFYININPATLDKNKDFRMALATPAFASKHLQKGMPLATFLNI
jgi:fructose-1,6-bisphosphatase/inositol monophosphatase family enzyme